MSGPYEPPAGTGSLVQRPQVARAFGIVLRTARHGAALTQAELAIRAGLIRNHVGFIERGIQQPSLTTLINLADGLCIKPEMLVALTVGRLRREVQL